MKLAIRGLDVHEADFVNISKELLGRWMRAILDGDDEDESLKLNASQHNRKQRDHQNPVIHQEHSNSATFASAWRHLDILHAISSGTL